MKLLKNKKNILKLIIFIFMLFLFIYLGTKDYNTEVSDNVKFASSYKDISKNNIYRYTTSPEILDILNNSSGVLFLGFPSNIWSHYYADYLNEMGILNNLEVIYYYDFLKDRNLNNNTYQNIVNKLKPYLISNDLGNFDLSAPIVIIVKNGNIIYFNNEITNLVGEITPEDYFTDTQKNLLKAEFDIAIKKYMEV